MLRSQVIARQAVQPVEAVAGRDADFQKRYKALVNALSIMIRENGLVAATAFLTGKAENAQSPEALLLEHLQTQLQVNDLHASARDAGVSEYRHLVRRTLDVLLWYKRLAESLLDTEE